MCVHMYVSHNYVFKFIIFHIISTYGHMNSFHKYAQYLYIFICGNKYIDKHMHNMSPNIIHTVEEMQI